ncbi:N-acetyl-gamma-glutamyl-phosphate reductase [Spiribacter aquaticus]|uniref:N-acetyl-gamma-glutamyl-phosphate reductase n=1 Tax=Spiribacter aquaticus TaxID=1935996 RepID=A0A557RM00_9GAMM|nr:MULTISPECIES: N-acetyl-gamma-glutamyl-phosphate reductase [Spiribacter]KAF0279738.1 N-acetyl-gamma-glutamyl-phosphate reductase [Spiribacter roseus]TVO66155.1 N-acetyl-gamma-glutamyl-phosphate reductase [Spiribacter aquaticus]
MTISAAIVGGTGYTGLELLRLLAGHPQVSLEVITSRAQAGQPVSAVYPNLRGHVDLAFSPPDPAVLAGCDVVFFATPNGTAMEMAPALVEQGVRVIDLGADFRIRDLGVWSHWYGMDHACPALAAEAVYGLPEYGREAIRQARLVANPGCYPTAVQLGFLPLLEGGLVATDTLIADAKSGASGAGRVPKPHTLLCEAGENFHAYGASGHRHLPEIRQGLERAAAQPVGLTFVPHLVPMIRGIHATLYGRLRDPAVDLQAVYERRFADEPFVDVLPPGSHPETRSVRGSNMVRIAVHRPEGGDMALVLAVEDNLVKGAAGQAVQNMNLMLGLRETLGLQGISVLP